MRSLERAQGLPNGNVLLIALRSNPSGSKAPPTQTHEHIADARTVERAVEEWVSPVKDGLLQGPLDDVAVEWGTRYAQKKRQLFPTLLHVVDGITECRVGVDLTLVKLLLHPLLQHLHSRTTLVLGHLQPRFGCHIARARIGA